MKLRSLTSLVAILGMVSLAPHLPAQGKTPAKSAHQADFTGVWYPSSVNTFAFVYTDAQGQPLKTLPLTPWAQEKMKANHPIGKDGYTALNSNDPNVLCLPPGVPNVYIHAYPVEVLQVKGRTILFFEYGHFVRQIFTDGREHPKDANPTWMGDSIGKWEGDTLVVDSTGFNDKTWLDVAGNPHSEQLHVVERFHRPDHDTLLIDITIEDPQAYTATLKTTRKYILKPDWNIMEYICEDNQVSFNAFEKKVGVEDEKPAGNASTPAAGSPRSIAAIVGDWKGTVALADGRSFAATASFSADSTGSLIAEDPAAALKLQFKTVSVAAGGAVTGITADGTNLIGTLSADGKQIKGDIILPNGTGHKISIVRP